MSERQDNVLAGKDLEGDDEPDDPQQDSEEHMDRLSPAYNGSERESGSTRAQLKNTVSTDEIVREGDFPPEVPVYDHRDREAVVLNEQRYRHISNYLLRGVFLFPGLIKFNLHG